MNGDDDILDVLLSMPEARYEPDIRDYLVRRHQALLLELGKLEDLLGKPRTVIPWSQRNRLHRG
jgi:hypothetical protein